MFMNKKKGGKYGAISFLKTMVPLSREIYLKVNKKMSLSLYQNIEMHFYVHETTLKSLLGIIFDQNVRVGHKVTIPLRNLTP